MRREHVVIGSDNTHIGTVHQLQHGFFLARAGGNAVRQITATELTSIDGLTGHLLNIAKVILAGRQTPLGNTMGNSNNFRMHHIKPN